MYQKVHLINGEVIGLFDVHPAYDKGDYYVGKDASEKHTTIPFSSVLYVEET